MHGTWSLAAELAGFMDPTPTTFDNLYFKQLLGGGGSFQTDKGLLQSQDTTALVQHYASNQTAFFQDFSTAYQKKMSLHGFVSEGMSALELGGQDTLAQLNQPQLDQPSTTGGVADDETSVPKMPLNTDLAASAPEEVLPLAGQHEAPSDTADDQTMEDIPEPPSADEALTESTSQTSQGLQLPPQQLHSRLSQVPAYAQLPQDGQSAVQQFLLSSEESWLALWDICGMSVPSTDGPDAANNQLKDSPALVAAVAGQMQKLNAQLGVAMQQAGQSSSPPMLLPQLLAANPQLQQQLPMMMSNALDTASQSSPMQLNPSAMLNMAAAPVPTSIASPPGSLPHSSALFHQQASNLSAALQQFQTQPHLASRPLEDGHPGVQLGSLPATPQQAQDLLPFFPHSASVAALMDMSPSELRPTETLPASKQPRQLVIQEFQPGSPAAANPRPNPAKGSQLNTVHPTRVHAPKPPKQERDARMPAIPATTDPSQQLDPSQTTSGQQGGVGNGSASQETWNGARPVTSSRRPSKPLRRVNPDPSSDGGEGDDVSGSSDEDPNAPESGRKRPRSGRGNPKRKRRHRLAVVKGGWNEEDDAKLTRLVQQHRTDLTGKWADLAKDSFPERIPKQLRERWIFELAPEIKKGMWTLEEEELLIARHKLVKNKWAEIAKHIPNRTENVVKNHWNATARRVSRLMKRLRATPGALNSINFNSLEHYIMVTVCGGDPNTGVGHGPNTLPSPPVSMPAFSQDLTRRMQEGGQLPMAQQLMVSSQAMQLAAGMPQAMPSEMGQVLPSGPTPPPLDPQMDRPMGKPRLKRRTIADMCLEGQQNMGRAAMPLQPVPNPQPGPIGGHQQEGSHEEVVQGLLNLAKGV
ncbi:hypothetical protein WJX74_008066 [Apatococcus lobatus]|uniref:Uncharacterized protein n=1 Tax=Apatococcus lobatus TaxID=904363 RepID=A0AAW1QHF9_9CHLO